MQDHGSWELVSQALGCKHGLRVSRRHGFQAWVAGLGRGHGLQGQVISSIGCKHNLCITSVLSFIVWKYFCIMWSHEFITLCNCDPLDLPLHLTIKYKLSHPLLNNFNKLECFHVDYIIILFMHLNISSSFPQDIQSMKCAKDVAPRFATDQRKRRKWLRVRLTDRLLVLSGIKTDIYCFRLIVDARFLLF